MSADRIVTSVSLPAVLVEKIDELAGKEHRTRSNMIEYLLCDDSIRKEEYKSDLMNLYKELMEAFESSSYNAGNDIADSDSLNYDSGMAEAYSCCAEKVKSLMKSRGIWNEEQKKCN